jgi:hypothetical protein
VLRQLRAPPIQPSTDQTTAKHRDRTDHQRSSVEGNGDPGHKSSDGGPYTRAGQQTSRADGDDPVIEPAGLSNRSFSTSPRIRKTSSAVPRSGTDSRERSDRLKPGTRVSADAAVTNTQTLLNILKITSIKWRSLNGNQNVDTVNTSNLFSIRKRLKSLPRNIRSLSNCVYETAELK